MPCTRPDWTGNRSSIEAERCVHSEKVARANHAGSRGWTPGGSSARPPLVFSSPPIRGCLRGPLPCHRVC